MSRLRRSTAAISVLTGPVSEPNSAAWRAKCATLALQISFLLGMQAMLGQDPPIQRRSMTAVCRPDCAMCQANNLPPWPLPRISTSTCSGDTGFSITVIEGSRQLQLRVEQTLANCGEGE